MHLSIHGLGHVRGEADEIVEILVLECGANGEVHQMVELGRLVVGDDGCAWDRACAQRWQGCGDTGDALGANEKDRGEPKELCQTSPWQKGWSPGARARSFAVAGCQKAAQEGVVIDHRLGVGYMAINQEVNKHVGRDLDE